MEFELRASCLLNKYSYNLSHTPNPFSLVFQIGLSAFSQGCLPHNWDHRPVPPWPACSPKQDLNNSLPWLASNHDLPTLPPKQLRFRHEPPRYDTQNNFSGKGLRNREDNFFLSDLWYRISNLANGKALDYRHISNLVHLCCEDKHSLLEWVIQFVIKNSYLQSTYYPFQALRKREWLVILFSVRKLQQEWKWQKTQSKGDKPAGKVEHQMLSPWRLKQLNTLIPNVWNSHSKEGNWESP
jgi:hypothetical protein